MYVFFFLIFIFYFFSNRFETTIENNKNNLKIPRIWFYGDNQFLRNKNETLNQLNSSLFFLS